MAGGCSKSRKALCKPPGCEWVVGKGCKAAVAAPATGPNVKPVAVAAKAWSPLVTVAEMKVIIQDVAKHTIHDFSTAADAKTLMNAIVSEQVCAAFHTSIEVNYDLDKIEKLNIFGKTDDNSRSLIFICHKNAMKVANGMVESGVSLNQKRTKITNSKMAVVTFDERGRKYLAGMILSMLLELIETSLKVTTKLDKKRITVEHVRAAIAGDAELKAAFR